MSSPNSHVPSNSAQTSITPRSDSASAAAAGHRARRSSARSHALSSRSTSQPTSSDPISTSSEYHTEPTNVSMPLPSDAQS